MNGQSFARSMVVVVAASASLPGPAQVHAAPPLSCAPGVSAATLALDVMPRAFSPNMTALPGRHFIPAFQLTRKHQTLYMDTSVRIFGRRDFGAPDIHWSGDALILPHEAIPLSEIPAAPSTRPASPPG